MQSGSETKNMSENITENIKFLNDDYFESFDLKEFRTFLKDYPEHFDFLSFSVVDHFNSIDCMLSSEEIKQLLSELISLGFDINKKAKYKNDAGKKVTPLCSFCEYRQSDLIKIFIEFGASVDDKNLINNVIQGHSYAQVYEYDESDLETLKFLVEKGAPVKLDSMSKEILEDSDGLEICEKIKEIISYMSLAIDDDEDEDQEDYTESEDEENDEDLEKKAEMAYDDYISRDPDYAI